MTPLRNCGGTFCAEKPAQSVPPRVLACFILALALTASALLGVAGQPDTLDGTHWKVREKTFRAKIFFWNYDHIAFRGGTVVSVKAQRDGFAPASYLASRSDEGGTWTATMVDDQGAKLVWEGRRSGSRMEGSWTRMRLDGRTEATAWSAKRVVR